MMFRKLRAVIAVLLVICLVPVTPALADDNGGDIKLISQKKDNKPKIFEFCCSFLEKRCIYSKRGT